MKKILIVDDELSIRSLCYDVFKDDGYVILTAPSGEQALQLIQKEKPDVMLMDVNMPGYDGMAILKRMPTRPDKRIPVVIFSGFVTPELEKKAFEYGAADVIEKGLSIDQLKRRVLKVMHSAQPNGSAEQDHSKELILVVDDEASMRQLMTEFFKQKGYPIVCAGNGEDAVRLTREKKPKMILLDLVMPGIDGLLTLKRIRDFDPDVGVVMATGIRDDQMAKQAADLGCYHYVLKPFDLDYLELVVTTRLLMAD